MALILAGSVPAMAQSQDLDAGRTAPQLFSTNCSACHRSPQGLSKGQPAVMLTQFLRRHYTTGPRPAAQLAEYLAAAGAAPAPARAARQQPPRPAAEVQRPGAEGQRPAAEGQRQAAATPQSGQRERERAPRRAPALPPVLAAPEPEPVIEEIYPPPRRPRQRDEVATVRTDPEPVVVSPESGPVFHHRASSQVRRRALAVAAAPMPEANGDASPTPARTTARSAQSDRPATPSADAGGEAGKDPAAPPTDRETQVFSSPLP